MENFNAKDILHQVCACETREEARAFLEGLSLSKVELGLIACEGGAKVHKKRKGQRLTIIVEEHGRHIDWCNANGHTVANWAHYRSSERIRTGIYY